MPLKSVRLDIAKSYYFSAPLNIPKDLDLFGDRTSAVGARIMEIADGQNLPPYKAVISQISKREYFLQYSDSINYLINEQVQKCFGEKDWIANVFKRAKLLGQFDQKRISQRKLPGEELTKFQEELQETFNKGLYQNALYIYYRWFHGALQNEGMPKPNASSVTKREGPVRSQIRVNEKKGLIGNL